MPEFFAVTNRGIEEICAKEMASIHGVDLLRVEYRRVHVTYSGNGKALLALRTVDDIFIQLAEWQEISPHRSALGQLEALAYDLELWQAYDLRSEIDAISDIPAFSVSANFVGRRNYSSAEIKLAIAKSIEAITGWRYEEDDRESEINLRVFIEHEIALFGMRLAKSPLYKRAYKHDHLPGSLKPSVAAAMVALAQISPKQTLLDPCCGAGTILIEAAAMQANTIGGDQEEAAITAAQSNALAAGVPINVQTWDARALPLADASVDRIVTNLPWGRQVELDATLEEFYAEACAEMERVLAKHGRIVLLTNLPHLITFSGLHIEAKIEISLFGQQPTLVVATSPAQ